MLPQTLEYRLNAEVDPAFAARARLIFETVFALKPKRVLDAGCGRGFYVSGLTLIPGIKQVVGIDVKDAYLDKARQYVSDKKVSFLKENIYELPFEDGFFDVVISSEVMEHLSDDRAALKELKRITKPGGTIILSVPHHNFPFLWDPINWLLMRFFDSYVPKQIWWLAGIWADHERLYTSTQFEQLAKHAKLQIKHRASFIHYSWPFSHFWLYGVGKNLVERLGAVDFNRFTADRKPVSELLAKVMAFPSRFDPKDITGESSVDLLMVLQR